MGLSRIFGFPGGSVVKNLPAHRSLVWEDSLEEETAAHSSILAWKITWIEKLGVAKSWT